MAASMSKRRVESGLAKCRLGASAREKKVAECGRMFS